MARLGNLAQHNWEAEISWFIAKFRGNSFSSTVRRLAWAAMGKKGTSEQALSKSPREDCFDVRVRSSQFSSVKQTPLKYMICSHWQIPYRIFSSGS